MEDWEKTIIVWVVIGLIYTGYQYITEDKAQTSDYPTKNSRCKEPDNPYLPDSGHYAGFNWGERGNACRGNSRSFIEGCEMYVAQEQSYTKCNSK